MIVDTSAWVEYLRRTESAFDLLLDAAVRDGQAIATPAAVVTELLCGAAGEAEAANLLQLLSRFEIVIPDSLRGYRAAARIYRVCRRAGFTIRSTVDCMVAANALEDRRPLLARNRDFAVIARYTELELVISPDSGEPKPKERSPEESGEYRRGPKPSTTGRVPKRGISWSVSSGTSFPAPLVPSARRRSPAEPPETPSRRRGGSTSGSLHARDPHRDRLPSLGGFRPSGCTPVPPKLR